MATTRRSSVAKTPKAAAKKAAKARGAKNSSGVAQQEARGAHNPEVARSSRATATNHGGVAQLVEPGRIQAPHSVGGSSPSPAATDNPAFAALSPKHRAFVTEYLKDQDAVAAYKRAGYKATPAAAATNAHRLLRNAHISAAIESSQEKVLDRLEITNERILRQFARIAFCDARELLNPDDSPKHFHELDDDHAALIAGFEMHEEYVGSGEDRRFVGYTKKFKFKDGLGALKELAKLRGMYEIDNRQKGATLAEQLATFVAKIHSAGSRLPIKGAK